MDPRLGEAEDMTTTASTAISALRADMARLAAAQDTDTLLATWIDLCGLFHTATRPGRRAVIARAMDATQAELTTRGMTAEQFDNLDWCVEMGLEAR